MKYKALLLDIDNTLYEYQSTHSIAIEKVIVFCQKQFNISRNIIEQAYSDARKKVHIELSETAASHNRLLYFQKLCEILNINPLSYSLVMYNLYWDIFLEEIKPFKGVSSLLEKYKGHICLVTDLTAQIQYRKIQKLKLDTYCQSLVTSEEAGKEKPHPYMFLLALHKLNLQANEVCMIGDSYSKDILGALSLNIDAIWFNHEKKYEKNYDKNIKQVHKFIDILELI